MKKRNLAAILVMTLTLATGCGADPSEATVSHPVQTDAVQTDAAQANSQEAEGEMEVLVGKIEEIKDFMFTIVDGNGAEYSMSFDTAPEGLADVKEGDQVTVTYTGELSEVDAFTGTIISVEKTN